MTWVRRKEKADHECNVPASSWGTPLGGTGDLWLCDTCGIVWKIKMIRPRITRLGETVKSRYRRKTWVVANFMTQIMHGELPKEEEPEIVRES